MEYRFISLVTEKTQRMGEKMVAKVFFPSRVGIFAFIIKKIELNFSICIVTWRINNYVSRQEESKNRRKESTEKNNDTNALSSWRISRKFDSEVSQRFLNNNR